MNSLLHVSVVTVGCRANQADSAWLGRCLDPQRVAVVPAYEAADVVVVNSCAVTGQAERDVRRACHRARRLGGPDVRLLLTGCMVGACPDALDQLAPLWHVVPSRDRETIPALIHQLADEKLEATRSLAAAAADAAALLAAPSPTAPSPTAPVAEVKGVSTPVQTVPPILRRARPTLRVQDGCRVRCAYCAVPAGRGPERSLPLVEVEQRLELLARESAQEVVICGINLGAWGKDLDPRQQLADLVSALETRAPVPRLRLSSIEPWAWRAEMVDVWAKAQRLAPSLHLPLQSGDDGTLKRMRRPYGADRFRRLLDQIWQVRPETAVSTDILVGFPGEEDEAFQRTKELIAELPLASLHVFGFSPRPGTAAATFPDQLPREVIRDRVAQLRALGQEKKRSYGQSLHGSTVSVLFDGWDEALGELKGVEDHGFAVLVPSQEPLTGLWSVRIDSSRSTGELVGRLRSKRVIS